MSGVACWSKGAMMNGIRALALGCAAMLTLACARVGSAQAPPVVPVSAPVEPGGALAPIG